MICPLAPSTYTYCGLSFQDLGEPTPALMSTMSFLCRFQTSYGQCLPPSCNHCNVHIQKRDTGPHCSIHTQRGPQGLTAISIYRRGPQGLTHCSIHTQERTAGPYYRQGCGELLLHTISASPSVERSMSACLTVCGYGVHKNPWGAPGVDA